MKKDNIKQNFRKPVGRDLEIVSEDMLKEKGVTGNSLDMTSYIISSSYRGRMEIYMLKVELEEIRFMILRKI